MVVMAEQDDHLLKNDCLPLEILQSQENERLYTRYMGHGMDGLDGALFMASWLVQVRDVAMTKSYRSGVVMLASSILSCMIYFKFSLLTMTAQINTCSEAACHILWGSDLLDMPHQGRCLGQGYALLYEKLDR